MYYLFDIKYKKLLIVLKNNIIPYNYAFSFYVNDLKIFKF